MERQQLNPPAPGTFRERRNSLRQNAGGGVLLLLGHMLQPRNYRDNVYPFRQNSHFLYYTGISEPDLALLCYPDPDYDVLFARPSSLDDIVWSGGGEGRVEIARRAGIDTVEDLSRLGVYLTQARAQGLGVQYLPPYQATSLFRLAELLVIDPTEVEAGVSQGLVEAVVRQRSIKSADEIAEIEDALIITDRMHRTAMAAARPGVFEHQIAGAIQGIALACNRQQAYNPIVTVRGEVLHNHTHNNRLESGQLLLNDSGAESASGYASDITRTFPVNGKFTAEQRDVYETVLRVQLAGIDRIRPGIPYREIHLHAAKVMAEGLKEMGLMRGDASSAVEAGAHALFFPHGLGHMLGLDVHDMEDLGDIVGYPRGEPRNPQFGLNFLRLSRPLEAGFVLTVEPGIYFVPALIDRWKADNLHSDFIHYQNLDSFRGFGGIRIEDDVLVTADGARVLGPGIPKSISAVEETMGSV